jgi:hypothetical protein
VGDITVPVPDDRAGEFLSHVGAWLQAAKGSEWQVKPMVADKLPWDQERVGEFALAASVWNDFDATAKQLVETLNGADFKMEAKELAASLKLTGEIAVLQVVRAINLACRSRHRTDAIEVTAVLGNRGLRLHAEFADALLLGPHP